MKKSEVFDYLVIKELMKEKAFSNVERKKIENKIEKLMDTKGTYENKLLELYVNLYEEEDEVIRKDLRQRILKLVPNDYDIKSDIVYYSVSSPVVKIRELEELEKEHKFRQKVSENIEAARKSQNNILADTLYQQQKYEALLEPLRQYEKNLQEKLYYTIQVPDEYKDDINFLVTTVSQKVQHPDIINKLVWAEYVKPYIDGTFKRACIEDKPGIYKITNIDSGKCYIGKSTNVKKRITDHFKSSIGIKTIADQAVHHEIWKTGFWNWTIEVIIYCDKEQLNELEKYYIDFFKSNEFGFNKTKGGEG